jgi:DNA-directed RNA polymerase subunit RPC12/RpoP
MLKLENIDFTHIAEITNIATELKENDKVEYVCKSCGRRVVKCWKNLKRETLLVCSVCKRKVVMTARYGGPSTLSSSLRSRVDETCTQKYGSKSGFSRCRYKYDNELFNSSYEVAFWIFCKDNGLDISRNTKTLRLSCGCDYTPDFVVDGFLVDVKSAYTLRREGPFQAIQKLKFYHDAEIRVIDDEKLQSYKKLIESRYGDKFVRSLRTTKTRRETEHEKKQRKDVQAYWRPERGRATQALEAAAAKALKKELREQPDCFAALRDA